VLTERKRSCLEDTKWLELAARLAVLFTEHNLLELIRRTEELMMTQLIAMNKSLYNLDD